MHKLVLAILQILFFEPYLINASLTQLSSIILDKFIKVSFKSFTMANLFMEKFSINLGNSSFASIVKLFPKTIEKLETHLIIECLTF